MRIFISYAHVDRPSLQRILDILSRRGHDVWYDAKIPPGVDWDQYILYRVTECDLFLVFATPEAIASEACQRELQKAMDLSKPILTVRYQSNVELPEYLARLQYIDLSNSDSREANTKLRNAIDEIQMRLPEASKQAKFVQSPDLPMQTEVSESSDLPKQTKSSPQPETSDKLKNSAPPPGNRRWLIPAALISVLVLALIVVALLSQLRPPITPTVIVTTDPTPEITATPDPRPVVALSIGETCAEGTDLIKTLNSQSSPVVYSTSDSNATLTIAVTCPTTGRLTLQIDILPHNFPEILELDNLTLTNLPGDLDATAALQAISAYLYTNNFHESRQKFDSLVATLTNSTSPEAAGERAQLNFLRANSLLYEGCLPDAIKIYGMVITDAPNMYQAYYNRGIAESNRIFDKVNFPEEADSCLLLKPVRSENAADTDAAINTQMTVDALMDFAKIVTELKQIPDKVKAETMMAIATVDYMHGNFTNAGQFNTAYDQCGAVLPVNGIGAQERAFVEMCHGVVAVERALQISHLDDTEADTAPVCTQTLNLDQARVDLASAAQLAPDLTEIIFWQGAEALAEAELTCCQNPTDPKLASLRADMEMKFSQYLAQMAAWRKPLPLTQWHIDYAKRHSSASGYSYQCHPAASPAPATSPAS